VHPPTKLCPIQPPGFLSARQNNFFEKVPIPPKLRRRPQGTTSQPPTMSSFFTIPSAHKKRKRPVSQSEPPKKRLASSKDPKPPRKPRKERDESISGSENESDDGPRDVLDDDAASIASASSEGGETAAERRLRLAERYLENIREEVDEVGFDAEEIDRDLIAERLKEDAAESKGRMYRKLAQELSFESASRCWWRWNSDTVTSVAVCMPWAYTVSKDLGLAKWRIQELPENQWLPKERKRKQKRPTPPPKRRPEQVAFVRGDKKKAKDNAYQGHVDKILAVAASQDGKFVVTGGKDRRIIVWDAETLKCLRVFSQHRDAVTGLAFRRGTNQLYSCSKDRTIKIWSLDELAYIETLFGHQDEVLDIAALAQERCISVGARDRTARLWKVVEETQLVFRGGGSGAEKKSKHSSAGPKVQEGSIDRVAMIDEEMFVTGSDNGSLSLWVTHKKKPVFTLLLCHGVEAPLKPEEASAEVHPDPSIVPQPQPRWITALASIPYSDVILSGSWDGRVRAWRVSDDKKKLEAVGIVGESGIVNEVNGNDGQEVDGDQGAIRGIVNDISVFERGDRGKDGVCVVVAVGKEHRLGRWQVVQGKNGGVVFEIPRVQKMNGVAAPAS
jgi:ribosomal RNA-processing protein 9